MFGIFVAVKYDILPTNEANLTLPTVQAATTKIRFTNWLNIFCPPPPPKITRYTVCHALNSSLLYVMSSTQEGHLFDIISEFLYLASHMHILKDMHVTSQI